MRFRFIFLPLILFGFLLRAETPIEQASFSDLINSDIAYADAGDIVSVETVLWQKYIKAAQGDTARKAQHDRRALTYGDKTMRFSLERRGNRGSKGYPVYIALHGGGGAPSYVNDSQWE